MAEQEKQDKVLFYGDKLPDAVLPDEEWKRLYDEVNAADDPTDPAFRNYIYHILRKYTEQYCVGENANKCLMCGAEQHRPIGLCFTCFNSFRTRGVIRTCGRTRVVKNSQLLCIACKERPGRTMGICYNCYRLMRKANLKNPQELIAYKQAEKEREERRRMAEKKKLENSIFVQKDPKLFKFGK